MFRLMNHYDATSHHSCYFKRFFFAVSNAAYSVSHFAPYVQIDLVDGIHAPTVTWPFADEESVYSELTRLDNLPVDYELDLMIHAPDRVLEELLRVNAKRYIVHLNSTEHLQTCIEEIKKAAREVSVGVVIGDDVSQLAPVLASVDGVQCMGIRHIGKQGSHMMSALFHSYNQFVILILMYLSLLMVVCQLRLFLCCMMPEYRVSSPDLLFFVVIFKRILLICLHLYVQLCSLSFLILYR